MDDLVQFLRDRLDEDEQTALAASTGPWRAYTGPERRWLSKGDLIHPVDTWDHQTGDPVIMTATWVDSQHIAWWNPERALREIEAKRRILDDVIPTMDGMTAQIHGEWGTGPLGPDDYESILLLRLLALPYADHTDYQDHWRP
ncbi:DUF6221 family protein [Streptomyces bacillaris]|uniref:DUF6221 family protein n=1 Tax=Streptomyces bacillaris TaxID=68179 RepID=UPI0034611E53